MRECGNWKFHIPSGAGRILDTLHAAGFEAYIVGGCVRDCILGRTPTDWDITTSASPQKMKQLFRKTVDTGIQHGTVTVLMPDGQYEVTTYRVDGEYLDGRHPEEVTFTASLTEDLKRRDFTINAMAYSEEKNYLWSIVFILEQVALMLAGIFTKRKWLTITAIVLSVIATLELTDGPSSIWLLLIGVGLIAFVAWQLVKNNKKPQQ